MREKKVTENFDLTGLELSRSVKHGVLAKILPMGNFGGGPGVKNLMTLCLLTSFGTFIFGCMLRFERLTRLINRIRQGVRR